MKTVYLTAAAVILGTFAPACDTSKQTVTPAETFEIGVCLAPHLQDADAAISAANDAISEARRAIQAGQPIDPSIVEKLSPLVQGASGVWLCFKREPS